MNSPMDAENAENLHKREAGEAVQIALAMVRSPTS